MIFEKKKNELYIVSSNNNSFIFSKFDYYKFSTLFTKMFEELGYTFTSYRICWLHDWDEPGDWYSSYNSKEDFEKLKDSDFCIPIMHFWLDFSKEEKTASISADGHVNRLKFSEDCNFNIEKFVKTFIKRYNKKDLD